MPHMYVGASCLITFVKAVIFPITAPSWVNTLVPWGAPEVVLPANSLRKRIILIYVLSVILESDTSINSTYITANKVKGLDGLLSPPAHSQLHHWSQDNHRPCHTSTQQGCRGLPWHTGTFPDSHSAEVMMNHIPVWIHVMVTLNTFLSNKIAILVKSNWWYPMSEVQAR